MASCFIPTNAVVADPWTGGALVVVSGHLTGGRYSGWRERVGVGRTWTDGEDGATHTAGREILLHAGADATAKEAGVVAAGSRVAVEACVCPCGSKVSLRLTGAACLQRAGRWLRCDTAAVHGDR